MVEKGLSTFSFGFEVPIAYLVLNFDKLKFELNIDGKLTSEIDSSSTLAQK